MGTCTDEERKLLDAILSGKGVLEARRAVRLERLRTDQQLVDLFAMARQRMREKAQAFRLCEETFDALCAALGVSQKDGGEIGWVWDVVEGEDP